MGGDEFYSVQPLFASCQGKRTDRPPYAGAVAGRSRLRPRRGEVDSSGSVIKSFGKYKNKVGDTAPRTSFDYNTKLYTIYHSIGNTNYIPIVTSRSSAWADLPRVMSVDRNSFTIKFINQENTASSWRQPFIYTCYKAD